MHKRRKVYHSLHRMKDDARTDYYEWRLESALVHMPANFAQEVKCYKPKNKYLSEEVVEGQTREPS